MVVPNDDVLQKLNDIYVKLEKAELELQEALIWGARPQELRDLFDELYRLKEEFKRIRGEYDAICLRSPEKKIC